MDQKPTMKASYESNADVQRWLQEQSLEDGRKPAFTPTLSSGSAALLRAMASWPAPGRWHSICGRAT